MTRRIFIVYTVKQGQCPVAAKMLELGSQAGIGGCPFSANRNAAQPIDVREALKSEAEQVCCVWIPRTEPTDCMLCLDPPNRAD